MDEDAAAAKIAATKRGADARKQAQDKKEQAQASSKIAAARRGKQARKDAEDQQKGAVVIQSRYRGKRSRGRPVGGEEQTRQRYYTPAEVALHDRADDVWVSLFHKVLDLTELVKEYLISFFHNKYRYYYKLIRGQN